MDPRRALETDYERILPLFPPLDGVSRGPTGSDPPAAANLRRPEEGTPTRRVRAPVAVRQQLHT
eukprot:9478935-Pyramimonas_sp.AAC.1